MPTIHRPLSGEPLILRLEEEVARAADPALLARHGRAARTIVKRGPLRMTMIVLAAGGSIAEHRAEGPITVQPVRGRIRFRVDAADHELGPGDLLSLGAGVPHSVASDGGGAFLLTLAHPESGGNG